MIGRKHRNVLKLIGVLLDYPKDEMWQYRDELIAAGNDAALSVSRRKQLQTFITVD